LGRPILLDVGVEASVEMTVESDLTAAPMLLFRPSGL